MEKVIENNKVAVLISPGFGSGWYSRNTKHQELLFSPKLVEMVRQGRANEINRNWMEENLGINSMYCGGASSLQIRWLPIGTSFMVGGYDGSENIITVDDLVLTA